MTNTVLTIDVEGHPWEDMGYRSVEILHSFLDDLECTSTIFVTPGVAEAKPELIQSLRSDGHEIALHIHPSRFYDGSDMLTDYDKDEIRGLIDWGTDTFEEHLGEAPVGFRAGRWQYSDSLLQVLSEYGFRYDSSFVPTSTREPYVLGGVTEYPLTCYQPSVLDTFIDLALSRESIPLYADWFIHKRPLLPILYASTKRVFNSGGYVMTSIHDYDIMEDQHRDSFRRYLSFLEKCAGDDGFSTVESLAVE